MFRIYHKLPYSMTGIISDVRDFDVALNDGDICPGQFWYMIN